MADVKKPDWPQTPDGTIDWETVFEDSETGIIPALSKANHKDILHKGTVVVVQQLFTRKNDAVQVEKFIRELDLILGETAGSEDLPKMRDSIISLLRRIKDGRIEKAAAYVAEKKREAAEDKKNKRKKKRQAERRAEEKGRKKSSTLIGLMAAAGTMLLITVIAIIIFVFVTGEPSDDPSSTPSENADYQTPPSESEPEPEPIEKPELELSDDGYPLDQMTPENIKELGPTVMMLQRFFWSGKIEGGAARGTALIPVLVIKDEKMAGRICDFSPNLIDSINLSLARTVPSGGKAEPDDLRKAGLIAMESVNKRLGKAWIRDLYLLYKVDKRLLAMSEECQFIE